MTLAVGDPSTRYRHAHTSTVFHRAFQVVRHPGGHLQALRVGLLHAVALRGEPCERLVGVGAQRGMAISPVNVRPSAPSIAAHNSSTRSGSPMSTPPRSASPSRLIWRYTRSGSERTPLPSASAAPRSSAAISRALSTECAAYAHPQPRGPCCAGCVRSCASELVRQAIRRELPQFCSRLLVAGLPKDRQPN